MTKALLRAGRTPVFRMMTQGRNWARSSRMIRAGEGALRSMKLVRKSGVLAAIDTADLDAATAQAGRLGPSVAGIKLGLEFYMAHGAPGYRRIAAVIAGQGPAPIFLDLKFHDIPNTVAGAVRSVAPLEPLIVNVHAAGGKTMMRAAR